MIYHPTISVVIPAYNAERTIVNCIESVYNQTVPVLEVIIIDDGSVDRTQLIVKEYIAEYKIDNLFIETQENSGPSKARNRGVKLSNGEWITFLDADDSWKANKIKKQIEFAYSHPEFSLIGTLMRSTKHISSNEFRVVTFDSLLFTNFILTSTVMVRKSIFELYYFDENMKYSEDYKLWLQITKSHKTAVLLDELVIYNALNDSTHSLSNQLWKMELNELKNFFYFYKMNDLSLPIYMLVSVYSFLKYIRRLLLSSITKLKQ